MTKQPKIFARIFILLFAFVILSACEPTFPEHQAVPGAFPTPRVTSTLIGGTAAFGAIAGSATGGSVAAGAITGGIVGGLIGLYADSRHALIQKLRGAGLQVIQLGDNLTIILPTDICFDFLSPYTTDACEPILLNTAALLKLYGNAAITVTGHTDDVGDPDQLRLLSRAQADAIVAFLWSHGIPHERIYARGLGAGCPMAENFTVPGSAMNRRIDITLRQS